MSSALVSLAFLLGLGLLSYGAWLAWHPAGFIVSGAMVVFVAVSYQRGA